MAGCSGYACSVHGGRHICLCCPSADKDLQGTEGPESKQNQRYLYLYVFWLIKGNVEGFRISHHTYMYF